MEHQLNKTQNQLTDRSNDKDGKFIYMCHYENCDFKTNRSDGFKLHIAETHENMLKQCEKCGKSLTSSSLSRHKRNRVCERKKARRTTAAKDQSVLSESSIVSTQMEKANVQPVCDEGILDVNLNCETHQRKYYVSS